MKVLLTGANGLLGRKIVQLCSNDGQIQLIATGRGEKRFDEDIPYASMDITKISEIESVFNQYQPEAIIHAAAMTNVDECELNQHACTLANVDGVKNLITCTKNIGGHFLHISTDFIFSGKEGPLKEDHHPDPVNFYGETKLAAERLVINSGLDWSIARTVLVYGVVKDMSRSNIILWVKKSLENGEDIQVVNDQFRTPTLAEDLADGCVRIVKQQAKGIFNISGFDFLTPYDMAIQTAEYFGLDSSLIHKTDSTKFIQPARRPLRTGFIISKAKNELDYNPHSFKDGIQIVASQVESIRTD